ncbi:MAG: hypothetical protein WBQ23_08465, partial [Bacteroidota bacterium]
GAAIGAGAALGTAVSTGSGAAGMAGGIEAASAVSAGAGTAAGVGATVSGAAFWTAGRVISAIILGLSLFTGGYFLNDALSPNSDKAVVNSGEALSSRAVESAGSQNNSASAAAGESAVSETGVQVTQSYENQGSASNSGGTNSGGSVNGRVSDSRSGGERVVYRNVYVTRIDTVYIPRQDQASALDDASKSTADGRGESRSIARFDTVYVALMQKVPDDRPITIIEQPYRPLPIMLPGRFEVELQREHLTTYPYIDYVRAGVERVQQQFAASLGYVFDEHHTAGITVGEKSFAMEYYRVENDSLFIFQRQPALFYGAGFYRYSQPLLPGVTPEITLQLGGCDFGPVLGARLALRFDPIERISMLLGANGTLLGYKYKDKLFTSHSLGISYGIRYRF